MHGSSPFSGPTRTRGRCGGWRYDPSRSGKALRGQPLLGDPQDSAGRGNRQSRGLPMGGTKPFTLADEAAWIRAGSPRNPDITGRELLAELIQRGVTVSYCGVWRCDGFTSQWRLCFIWRVGDAYDVEIVDYHGG